MGGTSAASPSWAGLMALVVEHAAAAQGNANPNLYALFRLQSEGGAAVFHDITGGNNSVPGVTGFSAGPGYDQASGIGTPDAFLLVQHWTDALRPSLTLNLAAPASNVSTGSSVQVGATTTVGGGFSSAVAFTVTGLPTGLTATFAPPNVAAPGAGSATLTLTAASSLAPGVYNLHVTATGGGIAETSTLAVTATAPSFALSPNQASVTLQQGGTGQITLTVTPAGGFRAAVAFTASGLPPGVTAGFSAAGLPSPGSGTSTVTLTASASAAIVGGASVTFTAAGGGVTQHIVVPVTVQQAVALTAAATDAELPAGRQPDSGAYRDPRRRAYQRTDQHFRAPRRPHCQRLVLDTGLGGYFARCIGRGCRRSAPSHLFDHFRGCHQDRHGGIDDHAGAFRAL